MCASILCQLLRFYSVDSLDLFLGVLLLSCPIMLPAIIVHTLDVFKVEMNMIVGTLISPQGCGAVKHSTGFGSDFREKPDPTKNFH